MTSRSYPRTTLEAFPFDRVDYACSIEGPRPRRFSADWGPLVLLALCAILTGVWR